MVHPSHPVFFLVWTVRDTLTHLIGVVFALALFGAAPLASASEYRHPMASKLMRREAFRAAARQYRDAHQARPALAGPLAGMALCHCRLGELDKAWISIDEAEQRDPTEPMIYEARACVSEAEGDLVAAAGYLEQAADLSVDPTHLSQLGTHLQRQGLFREAMDVVWLMRDAGYRGRSSSALAVRSELAAGDVADATLVAEEIAQEGKTHRSGMILGTLVALSHEDLVGESVEPYTHFAPRTRTADSVLLWRAEASRLLGMLDVAEQQAGRRKQEPQDPYGVSIVARLACDLGDLDSAEAHLEVARRRWPLHPSPILTEAVLRVRQGHLADAHRLLDLARERGLPAWDRHVEDDLLWELSRVDPTY